MWDPKTKTHLIHAYPITVRFSETVLNHTGKFLYLLQIIIIENGNRAADEPSSKRGKNSGFPLDSQVAQEI